MKFFKDYFYLIILLCLLSSCFNRELRGKVKKSQDKGTYLVIEDDNGGKCGNILVDGKVWPYKIGEKGKIESGEHRIECGGSLTINIKESTVFHFDYWGP
jgi:hypothetical protein